MNFIIKDNTVACMDALKTACLNFLEEASAELESQTKRNSAVGRVYGGQTKGDWQHYVDSANMKAVVGNTLENAIWEEYGTGEYALNDDGRKGGWWIPVGNESGMISPAVVEAYGFTTSTNKAGQTFAHTYGKPPKRMFENAKNTVEPMLERALQNQLARLR